MDVLYSLWRDHRAAVLALAAGLLLGWWLFRATPPTGGPVLSRREAGQVRATVARDTAVARATATLADAQTRIGWLAYDSAQLTRAHARALTALSHAPKPAVRPDTSAAALHSALTDYVQRARRAARAR